MKNEDTKEYYSMTYSCSNCGKGFTETFDYGERASQGTCPHCGVQPIRKTRYDMEKEY